MERITVVKIGGNVIDNPAAMKRFLKEFAALEGPKILVHGGGKLATRLAERLELKARDILAYPTSLSGGNQQKVVLAKMLSCDLKVLILDEPTKGIDVGAKYSLYTSMNELAAQGYAIIMISSEMPEVLGMADRVIVMKNGHITGRFDDMQQVTSEKILAASVLSERDEADTENTRM